MQHFYVYMLKCSDNSYYTGWTLDLKRRLSQHMQGLASKYTRGRLPVYIIYSEELASKSEALKREHAIKALSRMQKSRLAGL